MNVQGSHKANRINICYKPKNCEGQKSKNFLIRNSLFDIHYSMTKRLVGVYFSAENAGAILQCLKSI